MVTVTKEGGGTRTHRQRDEVEGLPLQVGDATVCDEIDPVGGLHDEAVVPGRVGGGDGDPRAGAVEDVGGGGRLDRLRAGGHRHQHPLGLLAAAAAAANARGEGAGEEQAPRGSAGGCGGTPHQRRRCGRGGHPESPTVAAGFLPCYSAERRCGSGADSGRGGYLSVLSGAFRRFGFPSGCRDSQRSGYCLLQF
jgi:hypothetical protein